MVRTSRRTVTSTEFTTTQTGTVNDLDFAGASLIRCNNATDLSITGLVAGYLGQRVTIISVGAGNVFFTNENLGSSAQNRFVIPVTSGPGYPLKGGYGYITLQYDSISGRWRVVQHEQGEGISPAFAAGNFVANGAMTWTLTAPDMSAYRYYLRGKQLFWWFQLDTTSVTAPLNTQLQLLIPGGFTCGLAAQGYVFIIDNGTFTSGRWYMGSSTHIFLEKPTAANWLAAVNTTYVAANGNIEVQ